MKSETPIRKLFLDDIRNPRDCAYYMLEPKVYYEESWDIVRNYNEFVEYLKNNPIPDLISFDHDLADIHYKMPFEDWNEGTSEQLGVEETGLDCAKLLVDLCVAKQVKLPEFLVHSMNPVGRINIHNYLTNAKKHLNL